MMGDYWKTFIEAEQQKTTTREGGSWHTGEPVARLRVGLYVTVCLFLTGGVLVLSALVGVLTLRGVWWVIGPGGCVGLEAVLAGAVVTYVGQGLSNTALAQGYLVLGALSIVSFVVQMTLLALLAALGPAPSPAPLGEQGAVQAWIQLLAGAQGAMAVLVGCMVGFSILVTSCCCHAPKDNVVGVYHPR
ncbi:uncharacterized protein [Panulirus ornatus]|uniref:uncharacterized protein n=1 Tax=Panulirus ornatus TaxID=150431 RepID=UPI003A8A91F2